MNSSRNRPTHPPTRSPLRRPRSRPSLTGCPRNGSPSAPGSEEAPAWGKMGTKKSQRKNNKRRETRHKRLQTEGQHRQAGRQRLIVCMPKQTKVERGHPRPVTKCSTPPPPPTPEAVGMVCGLTTTTSKRGYVAPPSRRARRRLLILGLREPSTVSLENKKTYTKYKYIATGTGSACYRAPQKGAPATINTRVARAVKRFP